MFKLDIANKCSVEPIFSQGFNLLPQDITRMITDYLIIDSKDAYDVIQYLDYSNKSLIIGLRKERLQKGPDIKEIYQALSLPENNDREISVKIKDLINLNMYSSVYKLFKSIISKEDVALDINANDVSNLFDMAIERHKFGNARKIYDWYYDVICKGDDEDCRIYGKGLLWWLKNGDDKQVEFISDYFDEYNPEAEEADEIIPLAYNKGLFKLSAEALQSIFDNNDIEDYTVNTYLYEALLSGYEESFVSTFRDQTSYAVDEPNENWLEAMDELATNTQWSKQARSILQGKVLQNAIDQYLPNTF